MPTTIVESLGVAVRQMRLQLALSQEQLAERSGLSRSYVGEVERGCVVASIVTVQKLAVALETDGATLLERTQSVGPNGGSRQRRLASIAG